METIDGFEQHMREVLHSADARPAGFTAAQVIAKGQHRRRARTLTVSGFALVAAGAVAAVPNALATGHRAAVAVPTAPGAVPPALAPATSSSALAQAAAPGTIDIGGGYKLTLTSDSMTFVGPDGQSMSEPFESGPDAGLLGGDGRAVVGLYRGYGQVASATVTVDGKTHPMTVVPLAGHPGWVVVYALLPTVPPVGTAISCLFFDAAGHQLMAFDTPGSNQTSLAEPWRR